MGGAWEALTIERDLLIELVGASPRGRPEIQARLQLVTAELLKLELNRPLRPVPEHEESEGHELRYFQK